MSNRGVVFKGMKFQKETKKTKQAKRKRDKSKKQKEQQFEVEKIVARRIIDGEKSYLVKWLGFTAKYNTWEPPENLTGVQDLIQQYETSLDQQKPSDTNLKPRKPLSTKIYSAQLDDSIYEKREQASPLQKSPYKKKRSSGQRELKIKKTKNSAKKEKFEEEDQTESLLAQKSPEPKSKKELSPKRKQVKETQKNERSKVERKTWKEKKKIKEECSAGKPGKISETKKASKNEQKTQVHSPCIIKQKFSQSEQEERNEQKERNKLKKIIEEVSSKVASEIITRLSSLEKRVIGMESKIDKLPLEKKEGFVEQEKEEMKEYDLENQQKISEWLQKAPDELPHPLQNPLLIDSQSEKVREDNNKEIIISLDDESQDNAEQDVGTSEKKSGSSYFIHPDKRVIEFEPFEGSSKIKDNISQVEGTIRSDPMPQRNKLENIPVKECFSET